MNRTEEFLTAIRPQLDEVELALHNGDATGRAAMWSRTTPLTLFGAAMNAVGWDRIGPVFEALGQQFSNCTSYRNEILAAEASGDLAYVVALEHTTASINGADPTPYALRVTTIFRREGGTWKVVHRHGDGIAGEDAAAVSALKAPGATLPPAQTTQGSRGGD
ncbi:YybH family protein [Intrasporangium sp. YIM S08009]|uniref:YybH family protein n=1 Tax=Intrasporangium zincisolvens TaxID=3080018 RepID=UPI002B056676|nr:nuclear transport factor 2 family protein [Intrasporangium sp. YIM S08009]